jgi:hypothetical protein
VFDDVAAGNAVEWAEVVGQFVPSEVKMKDSVEPFGGAGCGVGVELNAHDRSVGSSGFEGFAESAVAAADIEESAG